MFGLFRKKPFKNDRELTDEEIGFLYALADNLNLNYPKFKEGLNGQVIVGIAADPLAIKGSYLFTLDSEKWEKYCDKSASAFSIEGIYAFDVNNCKQQIILFTLEGLLHGFYCSVSIKDLNLLTVNSVNSYEKHWINSETNEISEILNELNPIRDKLDLSTSFKIKLSEDLYTIKILNNSNYLAVNSTGEIFELSHDPFEIRKVYNSVLELINSQRF